MQFFAPTFEDSVQIKQDKMSDDAYIKLICSLNKHQYEFFTHIMHMASTRADQVTCCLHITMFPGKDIEGIQVVIKKISKVFTTIGLYSSPPMTVEQIQTFVDNMLSNANDKPIIMIGDFNIDLSFKKNTSFSKFMKSKYNLDQYMKEYTTKYQTTIDLLFSNYPHLNVLSVV